MYKDTLELLCLPNTAKTKLHGIKNELTKSTADGQASVPVKKGTATLKISLPDYFQRIETASDFTVTVQTNYLLQNEAISFFTFKQRQERPPQVFSTNS